MNPECPSEFQQAVADARQAREAANALALAGYGGSLLQQVAAVLAALKLYRARQPVGCTRCAGQGHYEGAGADGDDSEALGVCSNCGGAGARWEPAPSP